MPAPIFCQENRLVALGATFIGLTLLRSDEIDAYEAERERKGPVTSILL